MKNKIIKIIVIISILLIIVDQTSKVLIDKFINEPIGNEYFKIEIVNNTGMAFGFNEGNGKNIFLTICVLVIIINFIRTQIERIDVKTSIALSFVLAGGISNLIDRIIRGSIFDFIKIYKFPIFNFADMCIVIGWILLIVFLAIYSKKIEVKD